MSIANRLFEICQTSFNRRIANDAMVSVGWPAATEFVGTEFEEAASKCDVQFGDICAAELARIISVKAQNPFEEIRTFSDGSHAQIHHEMALPCDEFLANCTDADYYDNE